MARSSFYFKWFVALLVIVALLLLVYFAHLPEKEEEVPEQVEEIDWQRIDRIQIVADEELYFAEDDGEYKLFKGDSIYNIDAERVRALFETFNNFQQGEQEPVDFQEWISSRADTTMLILKLYQNTEEVLNLYIYPDDRSTYYRYLDGDKIYSTSTISRKQFEWLDSLRD